MSLFDKIQEDIKAAMKAQDKVRLDALRAVKTELTLMKTANASHEISAEAEMKALMKLYNQRKEAAEIYNTQNRPDLAEPEVAQAKILEEYLPKQMTEEELVAALKEIIAQVGATSAKEMGKVMGVASKQLAGKADNKIVSAKVKELLG